MIGHTLKRLASLRSWRVDRDEAKLFNVASEEPRSFWASSTILCILDGNWSEMRLSIIRISSAALIGRRE